jgi:hypothetical protein
MYNIIIEVRGGTVVEIYADADDLNVSLIDWDEINGNCDKNDIRYVVKKISDLPVETKEKFLQMAILG